MKQLLIIVLGVTIYSFSLNGQMNYDSIFTHLGYTEKIESNILNETKTILIHIPVKFDTNKEYPLIIISDFMAFKPLSSITEIMAYNKTIPWCIVVCPITTNPRIEYSPIIDYTSKTKNGGLTIDFYEKELIPLLQSKYKISKKLLWGQNYSGMFTTFIMLNRPDLFDGYLSDIPQLEWLKEHFHKDDLFKNHYGQKTFYQLTWNSHKAKDYTTEMFLDKLEKAAPQNLIWKFKEDSDSILITHILTNYTYGLDLFFEEMNK